MFHFRYRITNSSLSIWLMCSVGCRAKDKQIVVAVFLAEGQGATRSVWLYKG